MNLLLEGAEPWAIFLKEIYYQAWKQFVLWEMIYLNLVLKAGMDTTDPSFHLFGIHRINKQMVYFF